MTSHRLCTTFPLRFGLILLFAIAFGSDAPADDVLNPKTHRSPSGQYELFVDPTNMEGKGPAVYRMTRDGVEVWAGTRPFSLWDARVTDAGMVAGYAYEGGVRVGGNHGTGYRGLSIIIIGADGEDLLHDTPASHTVPVRRNSQAGSDSPGVTGILVDETHDRFIVRIPHGGREHPAVWWTYRLSTGEKLGDFVPDHPTSGTLGFQKTLFAEFVPGTPLTLVQWYNYGQAQGKHTDGSSLSLLDAKGKSLWGLDLPGEYDGLGGKWNWYWSLVEPGIEQTSIGHRSFSFRSYSLSSRIDFTVEPDPESETGWSVVETARVEDRLPAGREGVSQPETNSIELELLGSIELKAPGNDEQPISGITNFAIDRAGNLGFIRWIGNGTVRFVRVDSSGEILTNEDLNLPQDDSTAMPRVAPVSLDRWVLVRQSYTEGVGTKAWWIDATTGALDPIEGFTSGGTRSLVPTGDGGFLILGSHHMEYTIQDELKRFNQDGQSSWNRREPGYGQGLSLESATWLDGVGVAALTVVARTIEFFDENGKHQRTIKLDEVLGQRPNYPTGLTADLNGGLILHDFNGSPSIYRIDAEDKVIASFQPRFPDGRTFGIRGDVQVAPDGTLWTSDGHALLRLNEEGVVDKVIGPQPSDDALEQIRAMTIDERGQIYAINERTSAVHVFDPDGTPLRTCRPLPTDFKTGGAGFGSITVDGDGTIYYKPGSRSMDDWKGTYLAFSEQCERIGFKDLAVDRIREKWHFKPGTTESWVLGYQSISLLDADGNVSKTIHRRPNQQWLQKVEDGAVAPDGSLAVIASPAGMGSRGPAVLCLYDADGEPIRTQPLTEESVYARVAFNGSTIVTADGSGIFLYDAEGGPPRKFVPPSPDAKQKWWYPYLPPGGTELWLRSSNSLTLLRYRLP